MPTLIASFGVRNGYPAGIKAGSMVLDVRHMFSRNPYHNPKLRVLDGTHPAVAEDILKTPRFDASYDALKKEVAAFPDEVWLCCTGGRHRSVYLAERLGRELGCPVKHRDL